MQRQSRPPAALRPRKFRLPRAAKRSDINLLETARLFASDAAPLKTDFTGYGLPADFLEDLAADADEFEQSINEQDAANRQKIDANASIDVIFDRMLAAKETLDVLVPNLFRKNAGKLASWTTASHVECPPKRKSENTPRPHKCRGTRACPYICFFIELKVWL